MTHASLADVRLKALVADVRRNMLEKAPPRIATLPVNGEFEDTEEIKRLEREQERVFSNLVDKVKDLELEVTSAKGREQEAQKLVEELAKERAKER